MLERTKKLNELKYKHWWKYNLKIAASLSKSHKKVKHIFSTIRNGFPGPSIWHQLNEKMNKTYSSGYGGSGKSRDPHSHAASVTFAICGPYQRQKVYRKFYEIG